VAASEWAELDTLTHALTDLRARQEGAKSVGSDEVVERIEQEAALMEERRDQLLAQLAKVVTHTGEPNENKAAADHVEAAGDNVDDETQRLERPRSMWDKLTQADVQRAKDEINLRRTEMLEKHTAELRELDAERAEVDAVEHAVGVFMRKFGSAMARGEVVPFDSRQLTGT
jgi:hypothetical protein